MSREYRVDAGHDYALNGIPPAMWQRAKDRAGAEGRAGTMERLTFDQHATVPNVGGEAIVGTWTDTCIR